MNPDLIYQLALTEVPNIGKAHAKILSASFPTARSVFEAPLQQLEAIEGIGKVRAASIKQFSDLGKAAKEITFIEKNAIETLFLTDNDYPKRLLDCFDPPTLLFYKGNTSLNSQRIISIVGSRRHTEYGQSIVNQLLTAMAPYHVLIVSGLAWGIDTVAHRSALGQGLPTIGVLAHGLDTVYPADNTTLARQMLTQGGLLTEFRSRTRPDKYNFPSRNRIVAGLSDATIVIESGLRGGSIITAEIAGGYHREVFAIPGRIGDSRSSGCNELIRTHRAAILSDPAQLPGIMGWEPPPPPHAASRPQPQELTENEMLVLQFLHERMAPGIDGSALDEIDALAALSRGQVAAALLSLELQGLVNSLPGNRYAAVVKG